MKFRKILCIICCMALLLMPISILCYANEIEDSSMVYLSGDELDRIYEMFQNQWHSLKKTFELESLSIIKESITPVYHVDLLEYGETGNLTIKPLWLGHDKNNPGNGKGNTYIAKVITKDGQYGGNLEIVINEDGSITTHHYPSANVDKIFKSYTASSSYADHAARIAKILGEDQPIPVQDVKYVLVNSVGSFFYVKNEKHDIMIAVGSIYADESHNQEVKKDSVLDPYTELLSIAKQYKTDYDEEVARKEEWEKEHPGEVWAFDGSPSISPIISGCSQVDNILDIAAYPGIGYLASADLEGEVGKPAESDGNKEGTEQVANDKDTNGCASTLSGSAALAVSIVSAGVIVRKRKKKS